MSGCRTAILKTRTRIVALFFAVWAAWLLPLCENAARAALTVAELRCENMASPLGIDVENPRLGWQLRATTRGENQAAYQILVATTAALLARDQGDLWNTGRIESTNTLNIPYAGRPLATSQQVFWKVRVWSDNTSAPMQNSSWSPVATFTMGVLDTPRGPGWQPGAQWITDEALKKLERKALGFASREAKRADTVKWAQLDFGAPQKIDTIRIRPIRHTLEAGYGFPLEFKVELSNTPDFKKPESIVYTTRCTTLPDTAAVDDTVLTGVSATARYLRLTTTKLRTPANDGANPILALSQIEVFSETKNIAPRATVTASDTSDDTTRWSPCALVDGLDPSVPDACANAPLYLRREFTVRPGLTRAIAHITGLGDYDLFVNGARVLGNLSPAWTVFSKTCYYNTYNFTPALHEGANVLSLAVHGGMYNVQPDAELPPDFVTPFRPLAAFGQIRLEYADGTVEMINTDGFWRANSNPDFSSGDNKWTQAGYNDKAWANSVETKGPSGKLRSQTPIGLMLPPARAGDFKCSNILLNRAYEAAREVQTGVFHTPIDLDLLSRYRVSGHTMRYAWNLDGVDLWFLNNMANSQTEDGLIPNLSPEYMVLTGASRDAPECGSAFITTAWQHYFWTGDMQPLQKYFDAMNDYADYLGTRAKKYLLAQSLPALSNNDDAPPALVATAAYYEATDTLARIAVALGRDDDASRLSKTAMNIAEAFNKIFLNVNANARKNSGKKKSEPQTDAAIYANGTQISQAIALTSGLAPPERRVAALDALVARIHADGDKVAEAAAGRAMNVWRALAQGGRFDVILAALGQRKKGFMELKDIQMDDAAINEWLYHDLAGLQPDPAGPGFKKIIIRPQIVGDITWARATHESPRGLVSSEWKREDGKLTLDVTIPVGATAAVFMPAKNPSTVMESGVPAAQAKGVRALRGGAACNEAVFEVESGHYVFSAEY